MDVEQARFPAIMWVSKPHDQSGSPCLPLHHPPFARLPSGWPRPPRWLPTSAVTCSTNFAIGILRGDRNIAAALRRNARDAAGVLPVLGITSP